jgi:large subunit ribosomal protein L24
MLSIRKNDTVKVLAGKDRGKSGKVLKVFPSENRAIVQGVNFVKKHMKQRRQDQQGGLIQQESPIQISNLIIVCKRCNQTTKIGVDILGDGTRVRHCKKCNEVL